MTRGGVRSLSSKHHIFSALMVSLSNQKVVAQGLHGPASWLTMRSPDFPGAARIRPPKQKKGSLAGALLASALKA
jgi:hypothetical protein